MKKTCARVGSLLLALALCVALLPAPARAEDEVLDVTPPPIPTQGDVWDGSTEAPTKLTKVDDVLYYEISTCAQLAFIAKNTDWLGKNFLLVNDLILNDVLLEANEHGDLSTDSAMLKEWTPIGRFSGTFDGNGHTISGLYIERPYDNEIGLFGYSRGTIRGITLVNSYVRGQEFVGGVVGSGYGTVTDCVNCGTVTGSRGSVGGVVGFSNTTVTDCVNYGTVTGGGSVGGVMGSSYGTVTNCVNYGTVTGRGDVGGVVGGGFTVTGCVNYGAVTGSGDDVGGVVGDGYNVGNCVNYGTVTGSGDYTGGIVGNGYRVNCCYNTGAVSGVSKVGGIVGGYDGGTTVTNCYNIGTVTGTGSLIGAIIGTDGALWDKDTITGCYYLKTDEINPDLFGCGGFDDPTLEPTGFFARNESEMQTQATYEGWDFAKTWAIDPIRNGGYPYLAWQDVTDVPLTGLTLGAKNVTLSVGDTAWLTVVPSPTHADLSQVEWTSSDESVVTVDQNGMLTAAGEGEAVVTASCGSISDSCAVTVSARAFTEYRLGKLTLRGENGSKLSAIPKGRFFVTVPVTKLEDGGDALILLASYTAQGKFRGLMYVSVRGLPAGATVELTLPVDNARGDISVIKAFPIASFTDPVPLGEGVIFQ